MPIPEDKGFGVIFGIMVSANYFLFFGQFHIFSLHFYTDSLFIYLPI
jgi:hypothetical protein